MQNNLNVGLAPIFKIQNYHLLHDLRWIQTKITIRQSGTKLADRVRVHKQQIRDTFICSKYSEHFNVCLQKNNIS